MALLQSRATDNLFILERLIELLREFPSDEPTRRRFIQEMIVWSARFGPLERGDPDLHHAIGSVYAEGWLPSLFGYMHVCQPSMSQKTRHTMPRSI